MRVARGRAAFAVACLLAVGPVACTRTGGVSEEDGGDGPRIGLLLAEKQVVRWEEFDRPLMERRIDQLCPECTVLAANAEGSVANQQRQASSMITRGVDALVLSPVDARAIRPAVERAARAGIPVVAYDRLAEGPISAFSSFDGVQVGRLQGRALLQAMADRGERPLIVMLNGASTDPNAAAFERGARSVLEGRVEIGKSYDTPGWDPRHANTNVTAALADLGAEEVDGVYAANDSIASGAIAALKGARLDPLPPVTGQDAELAALQRIVEGEQYMTVYKPYQREAFPAAEMAVALARGRSPADIAGEQVDNGTRENIPAVLSTPIPVTVDTIEETVVEGGLYTIDEICPPRFESECRRAGLI